MLMFSGGEIFGFFVCSVQTSSQCKYYVEECTRFILRVIVLTGKEPWNARVLVLAPLPVGLEV
jgi:hypothetical protein